MPQDSLLVSELFTPSSFCCHSEKKADPRKGLAKRLYLHGDLRTAPSSNPQHECSCSLLQHVSTQLPEDGKQLNSLLPSAYSYAAGAPGFKYHFLTGTFTLLILCLFVCLFSNSSRKLFHCFLGSLGCFFAG